LILLPSPTLPPQRTVSNLRKTLSGQLRMEETVNMGRPITKYDYDSKRMLVGHSDETEGVRHEIWITYTTHYGVFHNARCLSYEDNESATRTESALLDWQTCTSELDGMKKTSWKKDLFPTWWKKFGTVVEEESASKRNEQRRAASRQSQPKRKLTDTDSPSPKASKKPKKADNENRTSATPRPKKRSIDNAQARLNTSSTQQMD
jgi:hypothetical protein